MTTPYKQALEQMGKGADPEQTLYWFACYKRTILRALMIADAVESGKEVLDPRGKNVGRYDMDYAHDVGWNNCLENLKKIGAGE